MNRGLLFEIIRILLIVFACLFYAYYGIYKMLMVHPELVGRDFLRGCIATQYYFAGGDIYKTPPTFNPLWYPPLSLVAFAPLCAFGLESAKLMWFFTIHGLVFLTAWLIYRLCASIGQSNAALAVAIPLGSSMPLYQLIISGNINFLFFIGIGCIVYLILKGRPSACPLALAVFTWIKIWPALFVWAFIRQRRWKEVGNYSLSVLTLTGFSLLIFGWRTHVHFLEQLPYLSGFVGVFQVTSFAIILKLLLPESMAIVTFILNTLFFLILLIAWWIRSNFQGIDNDPFSRMVVDVLILLLLVLLCMPSSWLYHHAFLVILESFVLFFWLQHLALFRQVSMFLALAFVINSWEIIMYKLPVPGVGLVPLEILTRRSEFPFLHGLLASIPFVTTLGIFVWLLENYTELVRGFTHLHRAQTRR